MDKILKIGYNVFEVPQDQWDTGLLARATRLHADWVVLDMRLIVEFHGEHHYGAVIYGDDARKAQSAYQARQHLDLIKRRIAREAQFTYVEWPYSKKLNEEELRAVIEVALDEC
jgi:hypothetical protein